MLFDGMTAKAEAGATMELLGDVMKILLQSSTDNAAQLRLVGKSFRQMATDFDDMAKSIEDRNEQMRGEFEEQATKLETEADTMLRQKGTNTLKQVAALIRAVVKRK